jgi:PKD repeat protein
MSKVSRGHAMERWRLATSTVLAVALVGLCTPRLAAQASVQGQWHTLPYLMPINPIHIALLHTGKVLIVAGSGNDETVTDFQNAVWDLETGSFFTQSTAWDMFCNGMIALPDGRIFINGGNLAYDPFVGEPRSAVFDPTTLAFTDLENMAHGRWYPTVTMLGDGRVMTFAGQLGVTNPSVEIYTAGSGWSQEYIAGWGPPLYPRMHLLPDGRVVAVGPQRLTRIFNPATHTWSTGATTIYTVQRNYGTSVLLPLRPSEGYKPRIMIIGGGNGGINATATTEIIDMSVPTPQWQSGPSMSQARVELNATILPNGKVLTMGGSLTDEVASTASYNADLYDPITNTFSSAGVNAYPRLYHSGSLLLPDGTVMLVGGNPVRGSYEPHIEIYSPAYLFNPDGSPATRPTITSITPGTVPYASKFQVQTPDAANIASVVLIRPGSQTHAFDMDQRLIELPFTRGNGVLTVTAPPNGNIAPPGYYMLFVVSSAGVPSVAPFVRMVGTAAQLAGLVAGYAFDEGIGGTATDVSGNGNTGTISGAMWTAGKFGSALTFNGTSARVSIADSASLALTHAFTLEAWVFPTQPPAGWRAVIGKNVDRYYLMAGSNLNNPAAGGTFSTTNQNVYATAALPVNTWTHLAATYDRTAIRLFVNGVQVATGAQTAPVSTSTGVLTIGANLYGEYFTGLIDEVRVYNRALAAGEIQSDMATPLAGGSNSPPTATIVSPATNVTINPGGSVSFSGSGTDPDGTIAAYAWSFPGGTPSSSTVAAPGSVTYSTPGTYTASLTVTDNGGASSSPATRTITVADFSLSASPASRTVVPGAGTTYTATVTPGTGFTGTVAFSVTGLPAGATGSFNPTSVNGSGQTTLTVSTTGSTPTGSYPLTIRGTSGPVTRSATVTLVVVGEFSIAVAPTSRTITKTGTTTYSVTVTSQGFSGLVTLSVSGVPKFARATFTPSSLVNAGTSTLTITSSKKVNSGTYTLTVSGAGGGIVRSATVTLIVQ